MSAISALNYLCATVPLTTGLNFQFSSYVRESRQRLNTNAT